MQSSAANERLGWIQLPTHGVETSVHNLRRQHETRRSAAAIVSAAAAGCLFVVVVALVSTSGQGNSLRQQEGIPSVLSSKDVDGGDKELATIDRALALESKHDPVSDKPMLKQSPKESPHILKAPANAGTQQLVQGVGAHWASEMHAVEQKFTKEIKAAKIKTMDKLQQEERVALNKVHVIKDEGNEAVDKLMKAEKKEETVIAATEEESKLHQQLENVEREAEQRKAAIEAKISAVRSAAGGSLAKLEKIPTHSTRQTLDAAPASHHQVSANGHAKSDRSEIKQLEDQVAALNAKKLAVRAKVHQVEKQQEAERTVIAKKQQEQQEQQAEKQAEARAEARAKAVSRLAMDQSAPQPVPKISAVLKPKPKPARNLCTENNCDIQAEDKSDVTNGASIHHLSEVLDGDGGGSDKQEALREVQALQNEIRNDYKHVQQFALNQEHALDRVRQQTVAELGHQVMLAVEKSFLHDNRQEMQLQDAIQKGEKI